MGINIVVDECSEFSAVCLREFYAKAGIDSQLASSPTNGIDNEGETNGKGLNIVPTERKPVELDFAKTVKTMMTVQHFIDRLKKEAGISETTLKKSAPGDTVETLIASYNAD